MPVAAQVGGMLGHHDQVALPGVDHPFAARAQVALAGCVGLDQRDDLYPDSAAHITRATVTAMVAATMTISTTSFRWGRKGLKPMTAW